MTTSTRTPSRARRESLESPVRLTAHAGFGGRLHGLAVQPTLHLLRHGAMGTLFGGVRAPSTLGSHLRCYTWGTVSQLEKAGREFLIALAREAPLLPGAGTLAFIDIDSMQKRVYGHRKQGARFGHTKIAGKSLLVRGLNALAAVISTPIAAQAIGTARACGCTGQIIVRLDSAFYNAAVIGAIRRGGARFSVTTPMNSS